MMKLAVTSTILTLALAGAALAQQGNPGAHFVQNWDQDGDGAVSLDEAQTKRGDIFTLFDADEDGTLSSPEFAVFDEMRAADQEQMREEMGGKGKGMGMGKGMMQAEGGMMRAFNDPDGDGMVSRDEFVGRTADWFAMMDRNGDGQVTEDDFGR
jgi:Ca2+-binding EF-hand superfamily protein